MKFKKIAVSMVVILSIAFTFACNRSGGNKTAEVDFWSTYATEKILADIDVGKYDKIRMDAMLSVDAAQDESEGAQLILSAKTDVKAYDVTLSNLKFGNVVYDKSNITVYNQKYIEVKSITNGQSAVLPTGEYPDALLPFDAAKKAGENKIEAKRNQGIWFSFYVPRGTVPGLYTGSFTVRYDSKQQDIPVRLNVRDVAVSETTHTKTYFSVDAGWGVAYGEMDSSLDVINTYNRALSKYRLGGGQWPIGETQDWFGVFGVNRQDIADWVELVWDYIAEPRNASLALPYRFIEDETGENIDAAILTDTIVAFAKRCLSENVNLVDKLMGYYTMIDEPDMYGSAEHVKAVTDRVYAAIEAAAQQIKALPGDATFIEELAQSIRLIETVVPVGLYNESMANSIDTWCPGTVNYDSETERAKFETDREKWWYSCVGPTYPYASYLIEAAGFVPRVFDWQAEKFGITGNLYWAANLYKNPDGTPLEDCYQTSIRSVGMNGEGFLFYPGKPYGLTEPVGSVRLEGARDGIEDKELLLALRRGYAELSKASGYPFSAEALLESMYANLFDGMKIMTSSERFYKVRSQMLDFAELFNAPEKFAVADIRADGNNLTFDLVVSAACEMRKGNETLVPVATAGSGNNAIKIYSVTGSKTDGGVLNVSVVSPTGEKTIALPLGGASILTQSDAWIEHAQVLYGTAQTEQAGGETVAAITFDAAEENVTQRLVIGAEFVTKLSEKTDWLSVDLINLDAKNSVKYSICFEYERSPVYYEAVSGVLELGSGLTTITLRNIYAYPWNNGKVKRIHIYFGEKGDASRKVGVGSFTVAALD